MTDRLVHTDEAREAIAAECIGNTVYGLAQESGIVWLRDLDELEGSWLREAVIAPRYRRGRPTGHALITMFAYAELKPQRGGAWARRRYWFRAARDVAYAPWDHPIEAVDPVSIRPRKPSLVWVGQYCVSLLDRPGRHLHPRAER